MKPLELMDHGYTLKRVVQEFEKKLLMQIGQDFQWDIKKMAIYCCITNMGLRKKLLLYEINPVRREKILNPKQDPISLRSSQKKPAVSLNK